MVRTYTLAGTKQMAHTSDMAGTHKVARTYFLAGTVFMARTFILALTLILARTSPMAGTFPLARTRFSGFGGQWPVGDLNKMCMPQELDDVGFRRWLLMVRFVRHVEVVA